MAKGNVNPSPPPSNPAASPPPSAPPATGTGGSGPTGNSGFSMSDSSMQGLQNKAGDLGSRLSGISSGLRGLNFSGNALGPIGLFAVPALNASNDNAVSQADRGAKAFTDVQSGLKATQQTAVTTDTNQGNNFKSVDPTTNVKNVNGGGTSTLGNNTPGGSKVSGPGTINGGGTNTLGNNTPGGSKVSQGPNIKGGGVGPVGGLKAPGGPSVSAAPNIKGGGTGPPGTGPKAPGGPSVGAPPSIKGGGGPVGTGGVNTPGGPSVGAAPNIRGGGGPVGTGGPKGVGGPSVGAAPNIKGGGPVGTGGGPKGPGGAGVVAPPVIGGGPPGAPGSRPSTPGAPGSKPGTPGGGGKGGAIPTTPGGVGATPPGGKGTPPAGSTPGSVAGTKPSTTSPGPQNAVTSPSRGATPPGMSPGMAPPMAPGATPGATGGDRGGSKFGTGSGKGVFDAPKPGTPDSTITKAPPNSSSTPPPAPKPGTPATGGPTPGTPGSPTPKPGVPGSATPNTPGPQSAVTTPTQGAGPRGGVTPGMTPPPAASPGMAPPMAPGATPGATGGDRGGSKFGTGGGKGMFDAPKPPTPDNTITRAPGTSPSTPPPAPKPTPLSPPPATAPPAATSPNTAPPAQTPLPQSRPAPAANVPPANTPNPNNPTVQTRPAPNTTNPNATPDLVVAPPLVTPAPNTTNPSTSANPNPNPNVVSRSHPAAGNYQAQTRPDGGKGTKRAAIKKYLGINFIKGLFNKGDTNITPATNTNPSPNSNTSTAPPNPWVGLLKNPSANPQGIDVDTVKAEIDTAVNNGKPASARVLINRLQGTPQGAELQAHYDQAVQNKGDAGKVEVPKQLHFAWFGGTPSPDSVNGMLEWAAQTNENNGWKATLWTDGSSANWDPAVKQQLTDAGIEINSDVGTMVGDLSATVPPTGNNTTLKDVYAAAQNPDAKAYNLASDIARYAVLAKNGGVYVDVDIKPGSVSLDNIGDMKMHPTDVPVIGPRLRDTKSVQNALGDPGAQLTPDNVQAAADSRWNDGELGNAFIVTPPNGALITKFAEVIPQKFDTLNSRVGPEKLPADLKNQAPDISGPNALADNGLAPQIGLIGQVAMDPNGLDLGFNPGYMPSDVPAVQKSDFAAMFDPDVKNQWNGLEWVTPESESQLDTNENTRSAPDTDTNTDAPKQVKSGGAPPEMTPPTPESHRGKDVVTDESWRHDPARTADWSTPNNPVDRSTWADRRNDTDVRTVDVVVHDVRTDSTPSDIKSYQGLINYDLRRIETSPGNFVQEYTVKVYLDPAANVDPDVVAQVKENATNGVNSLLNQGHRLPSGDQFHLNLEFTGNPADAHTSIKVDPDNEGVDQTHWNPDVSPEVLAHETLHYLGIPDEYKDSSRVFQQHDTNSGVHQNDGGMMGSDVHLADPGIRPRHLWLIERTANSQVMVPDTRLDAPSPAAAPPPANTNPAPNTTSDTDTRPMPKRDAPESDSDAETSNEPPTKRKPGPDAWTNDAGPSAVDDSAMDIDSQADVDNLATEFGTLSLGDVNFSYNPAFAQLANGDIDLPTKDNYLAKLKESVEEGKPPSFVVNMIVSHENMGDINAVIDSITADAGSIAENMVFVVGVNGPDGSSTNMNANIAQANSDVASRKEPIALVPLPTFDPKDGFPFGRMRNGTMHSPATTFAIGAMNGKGTHPYISFQDFDTGSRQVTGGQKDVFTHFTDSLNSPEVGPIRPLLYSGGYRVGDPAKLVADTQSRIDSERDKINSRSAPAKNDKADLAQLKIAEDLLKKDPDGFVAKFDQAMRDDMDARSRQKDSAPLLPYSPEPNLFMDASVAIVDPSVKFSDRGNEFGDLSQSINEFAGKELVDLHTNQPGLDKITVDSAIDVDLQTNRNPLRGENFTSDFVDGAVGTDLSRLALGFAKTEGKQWPQSHVALTSVTNRMYGGDTPSTDRAAKGDVSGAKIRDAFGDKQPRADGTPNPKNKPHDQREAQQVITHEYSYDENTGKHTHTGSQGGWNPPKLDALKLGWEDKNSLNTAVSAPVPGHGNMGIDPQTDPTTVYPPKKEKVNGKVPVKTEADVQHIDQTTKQHKMAAMLNLALSSNPSNVTRTFGTLEHGVLPIAADPRPDGMFNAVHDALTGEPGSSKKGKGTEIKSAADMRAGAIQKGSIASPAITAQIANFRQQHGLENGHLVTALIEPGPPPITQTETETHAQENAAEQAADNAKTAKAEELAAKLLATEIGRPITIHGPNGPTTVQPFFEPKPEITSTSSKADIKKAENWKPPVFPPPLELDARPNPNGRTSYTPHAPSTSPRSAPDVQTRPAPEAQTRPAPPKPTPNPVIPMTTVAPQPVGQVPGTNLPSFFTDNKALGSITPTGVRGSDAVVGELQGVRPDDQARIKDALENDFETFLDRGRNFQVKIGNAWFEANVRAEMHADTDTAVDDAPDTKVDKNFQAATASTTTNTIATSNDIGASATAGVAMGPYGSLGGKAALATPAVSQSDTNSVTEQRAIKSSDDGSKKVTVPVSYEITVTDAAGNPRQYATLSTGTDVTLQVPADLSTITDSGRTSDKVTPADPAWGVKAEHAVPEAVVVKDSGKAFSDVAEKLHPSITKVGSPGREVLQNFLSPTSIRTNLPAMLGGFVTSPNLVSPHAGKGGAVQMTATLKDAKLVGTHDTAALDLKDTSAWGSSVSTTTKTGFDVTAGSGGNIGVPGQAGGTVGVTATYSARNAESVNAGTGSSRKTGIGVKNETGLYEVTAEVEVRTPSGESVKVEVTTHVRMGLHEAGAAGLPTPDGTRNTITDPATANTRFLPPYIADSLAAGDSKVGEFVPATKVQSQVEGALRDLPGFGKFLPQWNNPDANPRSSKGQGFGDVAEQLANQRKLTAHLSPAALKANMGSLLGQGVQVQLKNSGRTTNTYVNVTVKAKVSNPKHLGQADARPVSDSTTTGPKLDANTSTTKGWTAGVQGRVNIPVRTGVASLTPSPQAGMSYSHSWTDKISAGPAVSATSSNPGSADSQVFRQDVEFEVEITTFTRPRTWVRNVVPGAPGFHSPQPRTVAKTGAGLDKIDGEVNLWVSDGSTLKNDPGDGFRPGAPEPRQLENSPTVKDLLNPRQARPKSPEFLHVEAVTNTTALRDQAIDALNRAANGDSALTVPGTASRAQIDRMFTPENIKANLQKLVETGMQEQGLKYDRRVTDRSGAIGMSVKLGEAKLVSISDTTGADNSVSGGYKAGESSSVSRSVDLTAGINIPVRPNVTPPPAGTPSQPSGSGGAAVTAKVTPWSDSRTESSEIGGNVDRGRTTPGDARTVLIQIDAEFTIVGESRAGNFVHGGTPNAEGVTVNMPKSVFVRVSEDVARELGALPKVAPNVPKPDFPAMAPPSTVAVGEPGALGLSNVESVPDLSSVVDDLTSKLQTNTRKFGSDSLIPDSVLADSMSNLQRIVDLSSPTSVKAMIDSALDGGVPLLVHQPGTFGKDSYQVTLRARTDTPKFDQVVNDGVDMSHNTGGSRKESDGQGRGSGWGAGVRAPGLASPGSANPNVSGTAGVSAGANIGVSTSSSVTTSTTEAFSSSRTASGPAARYNVPIEFELVVEKGDKLVAKADSGKQEMVVRTHADNQKIAGPADTQPYMSAASRRGSELGTPEATAAFQQDNRASQLPPAASVENLRGAKDLRDAAVKALTEAGAGKGLTGKGTGSLNSLFSTLSPENLQPHLPSMLSGPLPVPGLKEAALTFGQDADVKVYAKLVNPRLGSLSDDVKIEHPLTTKTTETSSEAKVSETADASVGLAQGSAAVKQGDPKDTVNFGTGGVELRHAGEDSSAVSGGSSQAQGGSIKPKDTSRSGLVQFDVEYRIVATIGGKTGVVDLTVPGSAGVRMPATEVETVLNHELGDSLKDAQTEVKKAADDWRTAEKDVETARHEAQDAINEAAAVLARTDRPVGDAATALNTAIDTHVDAESRIPALETAVGNALADAARTRGTIQELNPQISSLSQDALASKNALDDAQANGAPQAELDRLGQEADVAHTALTDAQQQLTDAHAELDAQRRTAADARAELQAQQKVVAEAGAARTSAEQAHQKLDDARAARDKAIKDAETKLDDARRAADAKQQQWWDAKAKVDREIDTFNTTSQTPPPVPPKPDPTTTLDRKPLPPLPPQPESSVAESSRSAQTRSAPQPPNAPATGAPTAGGADGADVQAPTSVPTARTPAASGADGADVQAPTSVPSVVIDSHLKALTADAMLHASPLAKDVEAELRSNPGTYLDHEAGLDLLRASVVLDTKTDDIATLIQRHGVEAVARAFNKEFGRPIIESAQLQQFGNLSTPEGRAAFNGWAHGMWDTVDNTPSYTSNPAKLAADVFNHEKGYNRGTNFAQETAFADLVGASPLSDTISGTPQYGPGTDNQAFWVQKVLGDARLLPEGNVSAEAFTQAVTDNRTELGQALGVDLDDAKIAELRTALQDNGMVDDDPTPATEPAPPATEPPPPAAPATEPAPPAPPATEPASNRPPSDPNPLHSTASSAPWFDPHHPVPSQAIADVRATTPASSWVRGEDGGVLDSTKAGPHGINLQAWRGPIAYDNRVMNVDGVPVRDFTVRLHLNNGDADVQDRTRAGVEEMFNQGYRLPSGEQFHVTVEFTDNPADAHATVDVTDDPDGRANQLTWPAHTGSRQLAHEVGHFLGLRDEYLETEDVKPIFQHQDGRGRVVDDNSPMTQGVDEADARLKPRHLQLVEDRMTALQSHNRPQPTAEVRSDLPPPNMPKRGPDTMDPAGEATKRAREDLSDVDGDVEMTDQEVVLGNENGVHNAAFENLANGRTLTPINAGSYLDRTRQSIAHNEKPSFVVSMIVRASESNQLDGVISGVMANTQDMGGRVAFVLGVNASTQEEIDAAIATAAPAVHGRTEPVALVSVPHGHKGFKFGETRNGTLNSNAHEFAVTALAANGTHPYVAVMDFDAGDRTVRQGGHVFDHVTRLMDADEVGPADGPDVPAPVRPLMVGGGYRLAITPEHLHHDVLARIDGDTKTTDAQKEAFRARLGELGFAERFEHVINADMHARRNQQGIHPLLPYTPEPNLFVDGLVPLVDPNVRFGEGQAEFGQLGKSLNRFYATELARLHTPADPADTADATERAKVDVQNNRHPVRGQAFTTDFVAGDTGTDLSRIAYGLIKDGKLPQSHSALPNVTERFLDGKSAKAGTKFADERERLATGAHPVVEPFLPPVDGQTTTTWNPPKKMETQLGAPQKNRMNPAVSAPMPAPFNQMAAGIQNDQKVVAAHGLVASDHVSTTQRQLRYLNEDVLVRQPTPPTSPTGLYAVIGQARGIDPATLRRQVVSLAATHQAVTRAVADFTVSRPMHQGHLLGALVESHNWHMKPDAAENTGAGNARDLVGHVIATQLSVNVRIHQAGRNPVLLRPMGPPFEETVDIEMVMDGRQVTYRPHQGLQPEVRMH